MPANLADRRTFAHRATMKGPSLQRMAGVEPATLCLARGRTPPVVAAWLADSRVSLAIGAVRAMPVSADSGV